MSRHPYSDIAAARNGYEGVVATATFSFGNLVGEVVLADFHGTLSIITHHGCDPQKEDQGTSGVDSVSGMEEGLQEFDMEVDEMANGAIMAIPAIVMATKDNLGQALWLERLPDGRRNWTKDASFAEVATSVADAIVLMQEARARTVMWSTFVDRDKIYGKPALIEIRPVPHEADDDLSSQASWPWTIALQDVDTGDLMRREDSASLRGFERLSTALEAAGPRMRPVLVRVAEDPRQDLYDMRALETLQTMAERARAVVPPANGPRA